MAPWLTAMDHRSGLKLIFTFISVFLLVFGLGTMAMIFLPAVLTTIFGGFVPDSQLPLAQAREEEFLDIDSIPAKQLFPALPGVADVATGDWIRIPSIGVTVPLVQPLSLEDRDVIASLTRGAALYPNGIFPGRLGNAFIAAHSTGDPWHGKYRFAFSRAAELKPGGPIHIDYQGTRYTYKFTHSRVVKPTADFRVLSDRPVPTLTLMTCTPLWTAWKRLLQHAELTNITKLTSI